MNQLFWYADHAESNFSYSVYLNASYHWNDWLFCNRFRICGESSCNGPWPMPPIVNAYLATAGNIGAVITQLVCIIVSILIYLPFVKVANRVENDGI